MLCLNDAFVDKQILLEGVNKLKIKILLFTFINKVSQSKEKYNGFITLFKMLMARYVHLNTSI